MATTAAATDQGKSLEIPDLESCLGEPSPQLVEGMQKFIEKILAHVQVEDGSPGRLTPEELGHVRQQPSALLKTKRFLKTMAEKNRDAHVRLVYALYGVRRPLLNLIHPELAGIVSSQITNDILGLISKRTGSFEERLHGHLGDSGKTNLTLLLIGRPGVGKSSLVNSIIGQKVAKEGCTLDAATMKPQLFNVIINGVNIKIWDTPGLRDMGRNMSGKEAAFQHEARKLGKQIVNEGPPDLLLFCVDGSNAAPLAEEERVLRDIGLVFTSQVWKNTVLVLTKANLLRDPDGEDPDDARFLEKILQTKRSEFGELLLEMEVDSREDVKDVPLIPVGSGRDLVLADGKPWLPEFWLTCLERTKSQDAAAFLVHINRHRLTLRLDSNDKAKVSEDSDSDSDEDDDPMQRSVQSVHNARLELNRSQTNRFLKAMQKHLDKPNVADKTVFFSALAGVGALAAAVGPIVPLAFGALALGSLLAFKVQNKKS